MKKIKWREMAASDWGLASWIAEEDTPEEKILALWRTPKEGRVKIVKRDGARNKVLKNINFTTPEAAEIFANQYMKREEDAEMKKLETYRELKERQQKEFDDFEGKFFAFNKEQFEAGLKKIGYENSKNLNEKICSLGAGGYIRKDRIDAYLAMLKRWAEERTERRKEEKFLLNSLVYELQNHEFCITLDPSAALEALGYEKSSIDPKILKKACRMAL